MEFVNKEIFIYHADLCRTLANDKRLMILAMLGVREMNVGEMAEAIGVPLANISQHLSKLKSQGIVKDKKVAQNVFYSLSDPRMLTACNLIRSVLIDRMKSRGLVAQEIDAENVVTD